MKNISLPVQFEKISTLIQLNKRHKIIISTIIVTSAFVFSTQAENVLYKDYPHVFALGLVTYIFTLWALLQDINRLKAIILLILPTFFSVSVTLFYFLLPLYWVTKLPLAALIFGLSFYSLLLSQNVFNVAASRTIPLYRAASTVSFLFTLITAFLLFSVVYAFHLPFYWNGLVIFGLSFPLILQILWSIDMEGISQHLIVYTFLLSTIIAEVSVALSFWPVAPTIWALALSATFYIVVGIMTEFLKERLTAKTIWEFIGIGSIVMIVSLLATSWVG